MKKVPFYPADILIPGEGHENWSVIACDQFTSQPEYWNQVSSITEGSASAYHITFPEIYLGKGDEKRISEINFNMNEYLKNGVFKEYPDSMIFVERTLPSGKIRYGLVGCIDIDEYDYKKDKKPLIRATEGTVVERIPPRVKIRVDAPLELPHVMLLIDDPENTVILPLSTEKLECVYDFELMLGGGHIKGYLVPKNEQARIISALGRLERGENPLLFAVGDGNHSLATAKACYERTKEPAAKYVLCEVVNIHDPSLEFEPIYRVMFGVDPAEVIAGIKERFTAGEGSRAEYISKNESGDFYFDGLPAAVVQPFIDEYISSHPGASVDYIHGIEATRDLSRKENAVGFLFGGIDKSVLFSSVEKNGALPRKTFSMGEAESKRYYMEARRIKS